MSDEDFRVFIKNILLNRCLLKNSTISKYFDTEEGLSLLRRAFTDTSYDTENNYELFETEGDVVLNHYTLVYIQKKFQIKNVDKLTRIKHNLVSNKFIGGIALKNNFDKYLRFDKEAASFKYRKKNKKTEFDYDSFYVGMAQDCVEALLGVIQHILTTNLDHGVGISSEACYNLVSSLLDQTVIPTEYEDVVDYKTRFKEFLDSKGWNKDPRSDCSLQNSIKTFDINRDVTSQKYFKTFLNPNSALAKAAFLEIENEPTHKHISLGSYCADGTKNTRKLLVVKSAARKDEAEQLVAQELINIITTQYGEVMPVRSNFAPAKK
jgi:dsRNA-specific ribonuclease